MAAINNSQDNLLNKKKNEYHKVVFYDYDNKLKQRKDFELHSAY